VTYRLIYSRRVQRKLTQLPRSVTVRIIKALEELAEEEHPHFHVKRLTNSPLYSLRVGSYRIILIFEHQQLVILAVDVGHRSTIYDSF
jgi:mRNA interferase RelE/StbE